MLGPPGEVPDLPKWFVAEKTDYDENAGSLFGGDVGTTDAVAEGEPAEDSAEGGETDPAKDASPEQTDSAEDSAEDSNDTAVAEADFEPMTPPPSSRTDSSGGGGGGRVLIGAGAAVLGGALYGLASTQRGALGEATTTDELAQARTVVNAMVVTGGVVGVSGLGLTVSGLVDGGSIGFHTRF